VGDIVPDTKTLFTFAAMYLAPLVIIATIVATSYFVGSCNGYHRGFCEGKGGEINKGQCVRVTPVQGVK
jgi:hypothetical protein